MKRTAIDRTQYQPKPVERVEVDERGVKSRTVLLVIALLALAGVVVYFVMSSQAMVVSGWREIEANSVEMNCSQDFSFSYYLGGSGVSASAENKALVMAYTEATEKAYRVFNSREAFDGVGNILTLNENVNRPVQVDPALYQAFELIDRLGSRYVYLGPVYDEYNSLFFCSADWETEGYDPYQNPDIRDYFAQVAGFARSPEDVNVELLGDNTLRLNVSERYAAFAAEYGITRFVDLYWMTDAFIIDYLAQELETRGYDRGAISSYDGFARSLGESELSYSFAAYDLLTETTVCRAATMNYPGGISLVHLHSMPLNTEKELYYYTFADGTVRSAYADMTDGVSRNALPTLIATSSEMGCAETLLRLLPLYATAEPDEAALMQLTAQGVYPLYCRNRSIVSTDPRVTITDVMDGYSISAIE